MTRRGLVMTGVGVAITGRALAMTKVNRFCFVVIGNEVGVTVD